MPDDADRSLIRLAVDNGFLTRDEAMRYWQQLQAPGSPRFVQLLMQSGRLGPAELGKLRALWQQAGHSASSVGPSLAAPPGPAPAQLQPVQAPQAVAAPPRGPTPASTDDGSWEEALERDTQLARALFQRGLVTQERLRECRALQLQHRMRLGDVLVRKGYVERGALDEAVRAVAGPSGAPTAQAPAMTGGLDASTRSSALQGRIGGPAPGGVGRMPPPPVPSASGRIPRPTATHATASNPFLAPPEVVDQDAMPTLNVPPGGLTPGAFPRAGVQDAIPTLLGAPSEVSVEELNPFAMMANGPGAAASPRPPGHGAQRPPAGALSVDELNAFDDVPLGPPPGGDAAGSHEDITLPPSWSPLGQQPQPGPGPAPAPGGPADLPDSGGERAAAPRPAKKDKRTTARAAARDGGGGGAKKAIIALVIVAALIAALAGAYVAFG
ncbi:MAG: hypothetical protein M9894_11145 [Planctomycetes bacterium]|nr:hypothetical protein [Planctomycetota bacterium]